jgi:tRNA threonylcarbamoyladenosine biosynthesis protein TsaB
MLVFLSKIINMALIISINTSTRGCSVALHERGQLLACYELMTDKSSSGMLTTLIQRVVEDSGFSLSALDAVAAAQGPGSYTGLRIGVSTAKGLCFALDKPLLAVQTLKAMAAQMAAFTTPDTLLCPMIDARRMEVYCAVFDQNLIQIKPTEAKVIDNESFNELLINNKILFFGDGAAKCQTVLTQTTALFTQAVVFPSAASMGALALQKFESQELENLETFEPYYLKEFMTTTPKKKDIA